MTKAVLACFKLVAQRPKEKKMFNRTKIVKETKHGC